MTGLSVPVVGAQSYVADAELAATEGRFDDADRLYTAAFTNGSRLSRADVLQVLRGRATVRSALRDNAAATADLRALFSLDPRASFGDETAPSFRVLVGQVRASSEGPLAVEVVASTAPGGFEVVTRVEHDPGELVREIRVLELTGTEVRAHVGSTVTIDGVGELRYVVEVIGWGDAVLLSAGSPATPRILSGGVSAVAEDDDGGGQDDTGLFVGIGVGGGLLVVAAVVLAIVLSPSGQTDLTSPTELVRR